MREILFRGQRVDAKEWVYGYLYKEGSQSFILKGGRHYPDVVYGQSPLGILDWCEVIPETVGQYTGLTDKNGKKIFEGDVVFAGYGEYYQGTLEYSTTITVDMSNYDVLNALCIANVVEVIGNIHDQKEGV